MHATHPSSPLRLAALSAMMAVIGLTACGGGDDDPAPSPPAPAPTPAPTPSPAPAANIVPTSITLLAGGGLGSAGDCGDANGVADQARLGQAMDMAVAPDGTVHMLEKVCDGSGLTRVRSVSPTGQVTTPAVASREPVVPGGPLVSFRNGRSLAVGDDGTVYLSDGNEFFLLFPSYHQQGPATGIWTITPTGAQPFAGLRTWSLQPADGTGLQAQFLSVGRLVFGQGALFVHDYPDVIRRVTRDAQVTTVTTTRVWSITTMARACGSGLTARAAFPSPAVARELRRRRFLPTARSMPRCAAGLACIWTCIVTPPTEASRGSPASSRASRPLGTLSRRSIRRCLTSTGQAICTCSTVTSFGALRSNEISRMA